MSRITPPAASRTVTIIPPVTAIAFSPDARLNTFAWNGWSVRRWNEMFRLGAGPVPVPGGGAGTGLVAPGPVGTWIVGSGAPGAAPVGGWRLGTPPFWVGVAG